QSNARSVERPGSPPAGHRLRGAVDHLDVQPGLLEGVPGRVGHLLVREVPLDVVAARRLGLPARLGQQALPAGRGEFGAVRGQEAVITVLGLQERPARGVPAVELHVRHVGIGVRDDVLVAALGAGDLLLVAQPGLVPPVGCRVAVPARPEAVTAVGVTVGARPQVRRPVRRVVVARVGGVAVPGAGPLLLLRQGLLGTAGFLGPLALQVGRPRVLAGPARLFLRLLVAAAPGGQDDVRPAGQDGAARAGPAEETGPGPRDAPVPDPRAEEHTAEPTHFRSRQGRLGPAGFLGPLALQVGRPRVLAGPARLFLRLLVAAAPGGQDDVRPAGQDGAARAGPAEETGPGPRDAPVPAP